MRLNMLSASLLSMALIIVTAIVSVVAVNAKGIVGMPEIQPQVATLLLAGIGLILASLLLYHRR